MAVFGDLLDLRVTNV